MSQTLMIVSVLGYVCWVAYCAKKGVLRFENILETEAEKLKDEYKKLVAKKETISSDKNKIKDEVIKIYTLYEITKDITKKLHLSEAFEVFNGKLAQHVNHTSCQLLGNEDRHLDELKGVKDNLIFPLYSERKIIGHLVVEGLSSVDRDKFVILAQQFALTLRRIQLYEEVEQIALTDSLTELFNRRYLMRRLQEEIDRAKTKKIKTSMLMIDVDHFKNINDNFGHLTGDEVLHKVAALIKANIREIDIAGRFGGEEFCVVLPDSDKEGAQMAAERIRAAICADSLRAYDASLSVSVSIGVATYPKDAKDMAQLIDKADHALYKAKASGRNRVEFYND